MKDDITVFPHGISLIAEVVYREKTIMIETAKNADTGTSLGLGPIIYLIT